MAILATLFMFNLTYAGNCDTTKYAKEYQQLDFMSRRTTVNDTVNGYSFVKISEKTLCVYYKGTLVETIIYDQNFFNSKIIRTDKNILEVVLYGNPKQSFLFLNGENLLKYAPKITGKNFRSKLDENLIYIEFDDGSHATFNLITKEFCYPKIL